MTIRELSIHGKWRFRIRNYACLTNSSHWPH